MYVGLGWDLSTSYQMVCGMCQNNCALIFQCLWQAHLEDDSGEEGSWWRDRQSSGLKAQCCHLEKHKEDKAWSWKPGWCSWIRVSAVTPIVLLYIFTCSNQYAPVLSRTNILRDVVWFSVRSTCTPNLFVYRAEGRVTPKESNVLCYREWSIARFSIARFGITLYPGPFFEGPGYEARLSSRYSPENTPIKTCTIYKVCNILIA